MIRGVLLSLFFTSISFAEEIIPVPSPPSCPYTCQLKLTSFDKAYHHLGTGDDPESILLEVLRDSKLVISLPVSSTPKGFRKKYPPYFDNSGVLSLIWSEDFMYLTIVERYDLGRPSGSSRPQALTYWLFGNKPIMINKANKTVVTTP